MSVRVMAMVFDAEGFTPTQKLIMLALADHANEEGKSIYPGVARLGRKTALAERTVRKTLGEMRDAKLILTIKESTAQMPTEYAINVSKLRNMVDEPPLHHVQVSPAPHAATPAPHAPDPSLTIIKPLPVAKPRDLLFDAICSVCQVDPATAGSSVGKVRSVLAKATPPYLPEEVEKFGQLWFADKWKTKPPTLWKLKEQIGLVRSEPAPTARPEPIAVYE